MILGFAPSPCRRPCVADKIPGWIGPCLRKALPRQQFWHKSSSMARKNLKIRERAPFGLTANGSRVTATHLECPWPKVSSVAAEAYKKAVDRIASHLVRLVDSENEFRFDDFSFADEVRFVEFYGQFLL